MDEKDLVNDINEVQILMRIEAKLDKLIPEVKDISRCHASMKESMSCKQPSNHGKEGGLPRHRQNEEIKDLWCWNCGYEDAIKADYVHRECHHYGLCKKCYKEHNNKKAYEPLKRLKKQSKEIYDNLPDEPEDCECGSTMGETNVYT